MLNAGNRLFLKKDSHKDTKNAKNHKEINFPFLRFLAFFVSLCESIELRD